MQLSINLPAAVTQVLAALQAQGYPAYAVGGCLRDSLLGRVVYDWDITTQASPQQVQQVFAGHKVLPTGIRHGTVTLLYGGLQLEITTYRTDGDYTDHRRPQTVQFAPRLEQDLARRDFTINAMACRPVALECGQPVACTDGSQLCRVVDLYGGMQDLDQRVIRCVGQAGQRFEEDALRMLRALRFAATLGFTLDPHTQQAMLTHQHLLAFVATERITAEVDRLLLGDAAVAVVDRYAGVLARALGLPQPAVENAAGLLARLPACRVVRWAALFAGDSGFEQHLAAMRLPRVQTQQIADALQAACIIQYLWPLTHALPDCAAAFGLAADKKTPAAGQADALGIFDTPLAFAHAAAGLAGDQIPTLLALLAARLGVQAARHGALLAAAAADRPHGQAVQALQQAADALDAPGLCLEQNQLAIGGREVLAHTPLRGAQIGQALRRALVAVITGRVANQPQALLDWLQQT